MLTVTLPGQDLNDRLADLADRVELVRWDMDGPLDEPTAARVDMVVIPHYFVRPGGLDLLRALPRLSLVQLPSAGYEHAEPYIPAGVALCNGRGVHDSGTAELALALTLAAQRGLPAAVHAQDEERWLSPFGPSLADRRVVLVGVGAVGSAVARRFAPFEVDLVRVGRTARDDEHGHVHGVDELPALVPDADVLVLVVPLSAQSAHLVDAGLLAAMKPGALLVNVGRGGLVDTDALLEALREGRVRAALDVTDPEPLPAGHPLWHAPNVLITAHQGGNTDATFPRVAALVRRQLEHLVAGEAPENLVPRA